MKSRLMKISSLFLAGVVMFSACEDDDKGTVNGDIVGTWKLVELSGTYTRTINNITRISPSTISFTTICYTQEW